MTMIKSYKHRISGCSVSLNIYSPLNTTLECWFFLVVGMVWTGLRFSLNWGLPGLGVTELFIYERERTFFFIFPLVGFYSFFFHNLFFHRINKTKKMWMSTAYMEKTRNCSCWFTGKSLSNALERVYNNHGVCIQLTKLHWACTQLSF